MSPTPQITTTGGAAQLQVKIDTTGVALVFKAMPKVAYFWVRDFLGRIMGSHRKAWFARKGVKFGRSGGIHVWGVNEGPSNAGPLDVLYRVTPRDKRKANNRDAAAGLSALEGQAYTGNIVLPVHEFGKVIKAGRRQSWMAIAINTRPKSPSRWMARYGAGRQFKVLPKKGVSPTQQLLLYEVVGKKARGRPRKDGTVKPGKTHLKLRWRLIKTAKMKPTLHMYDTWEALAGERSAQWEEASAKMVANMAKPDARDL